MENKILKLIKRPFINVEFKGSTFKLKKDNFQDNEKIYYFTGEFTKLSKMKVLDHNVKNIFIGLSFFIKNNKLGVSLFFEFYKNNKHKIFNLESIRKDDENLQVKYYNFNKILEKNILKLKCKYKDYFLKKKFEKCKIIW